MKCLSRIEVQGYMDRELEPSVMEEIQVHLEKCEDCSKLYNRATADKDLIGKLIGPKISLGETNPIPVFVPPVFYKRRTTFFRAIPYLVAASIIGIILLFRNEKTPAMQNLPEAEILFYEFYDGKDLNKMWHEKSQIIILQDEKGNVIQSIITN